MAKRSLQKAGIRKVCPLCASTDVKLDLDGIGGECKSCHAHSAELLEMSFIEVSHYKRRIAAQDRLRKFSLLHCEEVHAMLFVLMFATILIVFIIIARSKWGLW